MLYAYTLAGGYSEESLLVTWSGLVDLANVMDRRRSSCRRFIPHSRIGGLWIHEGLRGFEVRLYPASWWKGSGVDDGVDAFAEEGTGAGAGGVYSTIHKVFGHPGFRLAPRHGRMG